MGLAGRRDREELDARPPAVGALAARRVGARLERGLRRGAMRRLLPLTATPTPPVALRTCGPAPVLAALGCSRPAAPEPHPQVRSQRRPHLPPASELLDAGVTLWGRPPAQWEDQVRS